MLSTKVKKLGFKSSVNIKFDLGKTEYINRYLPTPSHAESLLGILKGFNDENYGHSHILIGPYGTGKSLLGTLIAGIVSKNITMKSFDHLKQKFSNVDDAIYEELTKVKNKKKKYLPVILNGYEGKFRKAIISAIIRTLNENKIDIMVPGIVGKILYTLQLWEAEFPNTYRKFKALISDREMTIELWRIEILNQNRKEIDWFSKIFPTLTSGSEFTVDYSEDFIWQLKFIIDELKKINIGLFIVYDEFGRFLNNLEVHEIHETMQDLQDIAELSDHYTKDLHLLLITHRNLRHYFLRFNEEYKNEFQRIEKRYRIYHVESDRSTFIRITEAHLSKLRKSHGITNFDLEVNKRFLRKYPLFPELNQVELEKLVIKGAYPLNPITVFLLPNLSALFGQNERTLFTFLESEDFGGLLHHLNLSLNEFLPSKLFDYFFPNIFEVDFSDEKYNPLKIYKKVSSDIADLHNDSINLLKFITLWELAGLQSKFKITTEFLAFAFCEDEKDIVEIIQKLESSKAIRFNRVRGYWELFEGSSFIVDELIAQRIDQTNISRENKLLILEQFLEKRYFLANNYNDKKSMTRFASVNLIYGSDILNGIHDSRAIRKAKNSDALVNYVILDSVNEMETIKKCIQNFNDKQSIYCISQLSFEQIDSSILYYQILTNMLLENDLLQSDKNLKNELEIWKEDISYDIKEFINTYTRFSSDLYWYIEGENERVKNEIVLGNKLSDLMFRIYPDTPEVRNDSYNRRKVNNVQLKAGYKVVDHIINYFDKHQFNIEGNGPDYLIYATIFKNNDLDINNLSTIKNNELCKIRKVLVNKIQNYPVGKLSEIVNILKERPFGVREPLIPIFLVSLLRDRWDQFMFYKNDMFVNNISGEILFQMVNEAEDYRYVSFRTDKKYNLFFEKLDVIFSKWQSEYYSQPKLIKITSSMLKWLRSLPRYTQISNKLESDLLELKNNIRQVEVDPREAIEKIYCVYHGDFSLFRKHIEVLSNYVKQQKEQLESLLLNTVNVTSYEKLMSWAQNQDVSNQKENKLIRAILITKNDSSNWIDQIANELVGIEIENWSDTTKEMFEFQVLNGYKNATEKNFLEEKIDYIELNINGHTKGIKRVEFSPKSNSIFNNIQNVIRNGGRNVPKEEIEFLVYKLLEEFVE